MKSLKEQKVFGRSKRFKQAIFKSAEEEAQFWEKHSIVDYLNELEEVDNLFVLSPVLSKQIKERARKKLNR